MMFISTRGRAAPASFSDVLLAGLAPDGGLYLPQSWPQFSSGEIAAFKGMRYQDVAFAILSKFTAGSFSDTELREAVEAAYADFDAPEIAPLVPLGDGRYLLELFHGPTLAFKDIALQILGQLFSRALTKRGGRATVVAATSGDTGSAAIAALGGLPNIVTVVLHPKGRVSDVQRRQMTTSGHSNVANVAVTGATFDGAQSLVKALFADKAYAEQISLTAVNSINFARIAAQSVYYFTAIAQLEQPATFVVPTGNFGDIFAGEAAMRMGLGAARLVIATNANDIMARALNEGIYASGAAHATLSPSMDIQVASNFERALFEAADRDARWTDDAMNDFAATRKLVLPTAVLENLRARYSAFSSDDSETRAAIATVYKETGRIIDPHTAVGAAAAMKMGATSSPVVVLSTAHPAKFPDAVTAAIGKPPAVPSRLNGLEEKPEHCVDSDPELSLIKQIISSKLTA
jgi:threonine synthase